MNQSQNTTDAVGFARSAIALVTRSRQRDEPSPSEEADAEERASAERELQSALEQHGSSSVILCATDEVSPAAMRAVAASIRSLESSQ
ncbi:hypothetical protein [Microbacterium sp. C7(2022)]|uniref:hypothetical protein n=1 Tax=Microbacterium sp. C7(2022) TaxID=2992759 RepID=UPI00237A0CF7|nr:hypothetical protein [Microbacterium sp. C7(2022)]MDE0546279.1 hypothetical protein [Microbacterium sp. C7(2022)]